MKKAQMGLSSLGTAAIEIVTVVLIISIGALLLSNFGTGLASGSIAALTVSNGTSGLGTFASYVPTIALILVFLVILGLVFVIWRAYSGARQQ